jgi:hypothetical protein
MANSGTIKSSKCPSSFAGYCDMQWEFRWTAAPGAEPGVTVVSWELWTVGRTSSPTQAYTQIQMTVEDQSGRELLAYKSIKEALSFKGVLQDSGSFEVAHEIDGTASFTVSISTDIYEGYFRDATGTGVLETNMPYCVYIDTGDVILKAIPHIDNGQELKRAIPHDEDGHTFKICV